MSVAIHVGVAVGDVVMVIVPVGVGVSVLGAPGVVVDVALGVAVNTRVVVDVGMHCVV